MMLALLVILSLPYAQESYQNDGDGNHRQSADEDFQVRGHDGNPRLRENAAAGVAVRGLGIHYGAAY